MTVWTLPQITQARGLRGEASVDAELVERHGEDVLQEATYEAARRLIRMAETFAIVPHPDDFQYARTESDHPFAVKIRVWWEPSSKVIEIADHTELDGQVMEFERAPEPLMVAAAPPQPWLVETVDPMEPIAIQTIQYDLAGWREQERHWIYRRRG